MDKQEYVNLLVLAHNVEYQLLEVKQSLQTLKKALEEIEIKDMGELQ